MRGRRGGGAEVVLIQTLAALALLPAQESRPEEGFKSLVEGEHLAGWGMHAKKENVAPGRITVQIPFVVRDGAVVAQGDMTALLFTEKQYRDFTLRFEWRYKKPLGVVKDESKFDGESGVLLFVKETDEIWPKSLCVEGSFREAGAIKGMGIKAIAKNDAEARKPLAEWNETEIEVKEDKVAVRLNGAVVATASGLKAEAGSIAFQSEGHEIHFRNIRIREG